MSTDYNKKKVDELQELLKARSLPHTGKKADLVARLQQHDTKQASTAKPAAEDEIDWEDDAAAASTDAGAAAIAAGGLTQPANPTAVPNQVVDTDPSKTSDLKVDPPAPAATTTAATTTEETKVAQDFTSGAQATTLDAELEKRQKRAARFGITETHEDALKAIERAKKFGTGSESDKSAVKGLDEALPERRPKRGRGTEGDGDRNGKRSRVRGERDGGARREGGGAGAGLSQKDKEAAEARRKRFAAA